MPNGTGYFGPDLALMWGDDQYENFPEDNILPHCPGAFDRLVFSPPADMDPPAPMPWRLFDLGAATARILADSPYRVALPASSGWSHAFLTGKNHYRYPDTPADRMMYEPLCAGNYAAWRDDPARAVEDSGQQELLNRMCLAGALSALERRLRQTGFVDTRIFNSSKTFLIAPPA